jgi:LAO/AO transport system kinase
VSGLLSRFQNGDRQALARILTHIENETDVGDEALRALSQRTGHAHIIGLTGPPGAGKSTLANVIVKASRLKGQTIAVIAIDPSSPFSGGAMLGDRIRMLESQHDDGVYLRSMASRGQIGGLTIAAFGAAIALDAFGFDIVLIETVGAGQDEVDIARLADSVVLVQTPGMGDSIQAVKAGILEICDILVVNKADLPGADEVVRDLREQVREGPTEGWRIPVLPVSATSGEGIEQVLTELANHVNFSRKRQTLDQRQEARLHYHAKMLAVRELTRFLNGEYSSGARVSDPGERASAMLDSFTSARGRITP